MDINPQSTELLLTRLKEIQTQEGSWLQTAKRLGVSSAYLYDVVRGRRAAGPKILTQLKLRLVGFYLDDE